MLEANPAYAEPRLFDVRYSLCFLTDVISFMMHDPCTFFYFCKHQHRTGAMDQLKREGGICIQIGVFKGQGGEHDFCLISDLV